MTKECCCIYLALNFLFSFSLCLYVLKQFIATALKTTQHSDFLLDPFHGLFYLVLIMAFVATVAKIWIEISGTNARGVAKDLRDKQMMIKGHRGGMLTKWIVCRFLTDCDVDCYIVIYPSKNINELFANMTCLL